jgi:pyrroloquinoline quinone biosynthesis protein B
MKARVLAAGAHASGRPGLALSPDGIHWLLLNAAAGLRRPARRGARAELQAVVMTDASADHASGLLNLRNGGPIELYATPAVFERLTVALPVLPVLQHYCGVQWRLVAISGENRASSFRIDEWPTLEITAISITPHDGAVVGDNIALAVHDERSGARLFVAPGLDRVGTVEAAWMEDADCVFIGSPQASPRAHWAQELADELAPLQPRRKVLMRPLDGPRMAPPKGLELAYDGMEIEL